jgi:uncharacterized membrane protein
MMGEILKQLLTGRDNQTHDVARHLAVIAVLAGIGLQAWAIHKGQPFSLNDYGIGMGSLLSGLGVAIKLKENSEPSS